MKRSIYLFLVIVILCVSINTIQINLPVPQQIIIKLGLSMNRLQQLLKNFNTNQQNKIQIWKRVELTKGYLNQMNKELSKYNNTVAGSNNKVNGTKNVVIGNYNNIQGSNNWVFISKYTGNINGDLLVSLWKIQLDKSSQILIDPKLAISYIDEQKNKELVSQYFKSSRQFCNWDSWGKVTQRFNKLWNNYFGFSQFKKKVDTQINVATDSLLTKNKNLYQDQLSSSILSSSNTNSMYPTLDYKYPSIYNTYTSSSSYNAYPSSYNTYSGSSFNSFPYNKDNLFLNIDTISNSNNYLKKNLNRQQGESSNEHSYQQKQWKPTSYLELNKASTKQNNIKNDQYNFDTQNQYQYSQQSLLNEKQKGYQTSTRSSKIIIKPLIQDTYSNAYSYEYNPPYKTATLIQSKPYESQTTYQGLDNFKSNYQSPKFSQDYSKISSNNYFDNVKNSYSSSNNYNFNSYKIDKKQDIYQSKATRIQKDSNFEDFNYKTKSNYVKDPPKYAYKELNNLDLKYGSSNQLQQNKNNLFNFNNFNSNQNYGPLGIKVSLEKQKIDIGTPNLGFNYNMNW